MSQKSHIFILQNDHISDKQETTNMYKLVKHVIVIKCKHASYNNRNLCDTIHSSIGACSIVAGAVLYNFPSVIQY